MDAPLADTVLSDCLSALASPTRLSIMRELRIPRVLKDIAVQSPGETAPISRQSVRKHLDVLLEVGLATSRGAARDYGDTQEYIVSHQRVFSLSEEVRALARLAPLVELSGATVQGAAQTRAVAKKPALVLVKGLDEGRSFDLEPREDRAEWILGRRRGLDVSVDYDPSTSGEHAKIRWDGQHYAIEDLQSRNGTTVNFTRIASGRPQPIVHGDIIGVGRCLFVLRVPTR